MSRRPHEIGVESDLRIVTEEASISTVRARTFTLDDACYGGYIKRER